MSDDFLEKNREKDKYDKFVKNFISAPVKLEEEKNLEKLYDEQYETRKKTCHECDRTFKVEWFLKGIQTAKTRYCPRCGARL